MNPSEYDRMAKYEQDYWWHIARRTILEAILKKHLKNAHSMQISDIGCGTGGNYPLLKIFGKVTGFDMSEQALDYCRKQSAYDDLKLAKSTDIPEKTYNVITSFDVLEHIENDQETLNHWQRALRPGGLVFVTVPAFQWLFSAHDRAVHHKRRYTKRELVEKFEKAGFKIEQSSYFFFFTFPLVIIVRFLTKKSATPSTSYQPVPKPLAYLFIIASSLEAFVLEHNIKFPWGSSIFLVARKK